jgi:hypothetical protein
MRFAIWRLSYPGGLSNGQASFSIFNRSRYHFI